MWVLMLGGVRVDGCGGGRYIFGKLLVSEVRMNRNCECLV